MIVASLLLVVVDVAELERVGLARITADVQATVRPPASNSPDPPSARSPVWKVPVSSEAAPGKARVRVVLSPRTSPAFMERRWERVQGTYSERMGAVRPMTMRSIRRAADRPSSPASAPRRRGSVLHEVTVQLPIPPVDDHVRVARSHGRRQAVDVVRAGGRGRAVCPSVTAAEDDEALAASDRRHNGRDYKHLTNFPCILIATKLPRSEGRSTPTSPGSIALRSVAFHAKRSFGQRPVSRGLFSLPHNTWGVPERNLFEPIVVRDRWARQRVASNGELADADVRPLPRDAETGEQRDEPDHSEEGGGETQRRASKRLPPTWTARGSDTSWSTRGVLHGGVRAQASGVVPQDAAKI